MLNNRFNIGTVTVFGDYVLHDNDGTMLVSAFYDRAKTKVKAAGALIGLRNGFYFLEKRFAAETDKETSFKLAYKMLRANRDFFTLGYAVSSQLNKRYILTTESFLYNDLYQYLMANFDLPLLERWMPWIYKEGVNRSFFMVQDNYLTCTDPERPYRITSAGKTKDVCLKDLRVIKINLSDTDFSSLISEGLRQRCISISASEKSPRPLSYESFDDYIAKYGQGLVDNLEREVIPLTPLNGAVETLALKEKSLFPQQAACVNAMMALKKHKKHYGFFNEGMGVGKTLQAMSAVEAAEVESWLQKHPDKTLQDAYASEDVISYRTVIMAPGHLTKKWESELSKEIPYVKPVIVTSLSQLVELRNHKKPKGKEVYILSKDFCKLGSELEPIPTRVKHTLHPVTQYCRECDAQGVQSQMVLKGRKRLCPTCNSGSYIKKYEPEKVTALQCPSCGEALYKASRVGKTYFTPKDFASHTDSNDHCPLCGQALWGVHAKNIGNTRTPKWCKISHFTNFKRKARKTAYVLQGEEDDYLTRIPINDGVESCRTTGVRKVSPASFIKKYLKGYFDYCILDECHKYEGAGTAQANAAHVLVQASKFTLGLTGTISNGTAGSFFYLLWMLDPKLMQAKGYQFKDCLPFCKKYGTVETAYYINGSKEYNTSSRGSIASSPQVKAGISPLLYSEFLVEHSIMLDISDLSSYIPPLKEYVRLVNLPHEVFSAYWSTIKKSRVMLRTPEGKGLMGDIQNFGLSYPDKPCGRGDIMSLSYENLSISHVQNFEDYSDIDVLLPKEEELVNIVRNEMAEGRNCFIYACFTGVEESNVLYRLQKVVERHCNLKGRVEIIRSESPKAIDREEWMHKKAAEGKQVFICNPKVVETGLDFAFEHNGTFYNYPTIIFYQINNELAVMWQASRRSYRLNQPLESRIYWLAYEGTLQTTALEAMGDKMVATSAIQGKFSAQGLAAMSKNIDPRVRMAAAMSSGDTTDRETLSNMFDILNNEHEEQTTDERFGMWVKTTNFYKLLGIDKASPGMELFTFNETFPLETDSEEEPTASSESATFTGEQFSFLDIQSFFVFNEELYQSEKARPVKKKKPKPVMEGCLSLFDI